MIANRSYKWFFGCDFSIADDNVDDDIEITELDFEVSDKQKD